RRASTPPTCRRSPPSPRSRSPSPPRSRRARRPSSRRRSGRRRRARARRAAASLASRDCRRSPSVYVITYERMTSDDVTATAPEALGARVRALREAMGLSLRDLADRSGVSAPMLSQVERGETSPTLQVATRIAAGLELRLSQLLRLDEDGAVTVVRARERRRGGSTQAGHRFEILTAPLPGQ